MVRLEQTMPIHHIIPRHEWKKRFGNLKGINAPDNLVDLYVEQHAQVHMHYFNEITHLEFDRIASLATRGLIGKEEIHRRISSNANNGKQRTLGKHWKNSEEFKQKLSKVMKGKQHSLGHKNALGNRHTEEWKLKRSVEQRGVPKGTQPLVTCDHCLQVGGRSLMTRYHFGNCRKKNNG